MPSLIGEVSKRPNRKNCNFERNKKSKNATAFPIPPFFPFLPNLGELERWAWKDMRSFVFFSLQSTK